MIEIEITTINIIKIVVITADKPLLSINKNTKGLINFYKPPPRFELGTFASLDPPYYSFFLPRGSFFSKERRPTKTTLYQLSYEGTNHGKKDSIKT
ncbi:hypothetical protein CO155_02740 [Candidatus Pacearchaeota archaeon CG_4_9_14_3_um_filter_35_19]|nr:MAG: hypothetical protein AUJ63_00055 [Candidatus Pacearchaeota archaeon CG1_02_35_32]PJA69919.1 MAG: hypothetical protein CO155_02740 [Candidatus Pacearchaeota archaeon CG_4_9_14_3_um_filter_35_19]PJB94346.1 MAG: hypothetical protein CO081_01440 [Candidatus Pacearchaeota archaeon CG_4_9_14_0_8_um_filter_35_24]